MKSYPSCMYPSTTAIAKEIPMTPPAECASTRGSARITEESRGAKGPHLRFSALQNTHSRAIGCLAYGCPRGGF